MLFWDFPESFPRFLLLFVVLLAQCQVQLQRSLFVSYQLVWYTQMYEAAFAPRAHSADQSSNDSGRETEGWPTHSLNTSFFSVSSIKLASQEQDAIVILFSIKNSFNFHILDTQCQWTTQSFYFCAVSISIFTVNVCRKQDGQCITVAYSPTWRRRAAFSTFPTLIWPSALRRMEFTHLSNSAGQKSNNCNQVLRRRRCCGQRHNYSRTAP